MPTSYKPPQHVLIELRNAVTSLTSEELIELSEQLRDRIVQTLESARFTVEAKGETISASVGVGADLIGFKIDVPEGGPLTISSPQAEARPEPIAIRYDRNADEGAGDWMSDLHFSGDGRRATALDIVASKIKELADAVVISRKPGRS